MSGSRSIRRAVMPAVMAALGLSGAQVALAQYGRQITIPANTVVRLKMESALSSRDARVGDLFAAVPLAADRSGFPEGTRFQGVVREVARRTTKRPGMLDIQMQRAYFPDGAKVALSGQLASLGDEDVREMENGRLEARKESSGSKMDWKWAGYGAGAGAILSGVTGGKVLHGAVLGGLGGAVYAYLARNKGDRKTFRDVELPRGTEFGMRLDRATPFTQQSIYRYAVDEERAEGERREERLAGERREERLAGERREEQLARERAGLRHREATVWLNGRSVVLGEAPMNLSGILYVPLRPIAAAANMQFTHTAGQGTFALMTPDGWVRATAGEPRVTVGNRDPITLSDEPVSVNGTIFVSTDYLGRAANLSAYWDAAGARLELQTRR